MSRSHLSVCFALIVAGTIGCGGGEEERGILLPGERCVETLECVPGSMCFNEFCVGTGDLRVSLSFEVDTDLDLHLETPFGNEIYFADPSADGGTLDVDQCIGFCGSDETHVENIVFPAGAPSGSYLVWVENYDGRDAGAFTIEVDISGGDLLVFEGSLPDVAKATTEAAEFRL